MEEKEQKQIICLRYNQIFSRNRFPVKVAKHIDSSVC
jgi:hypothetical protein